MAGILGQGSERTRVADPVAYARYMQATQTNPAQREINSVINTFKGGIPEPVVSPRMPSAYLTKEVPMDEHDVEGVADFLNDSEDVGPAVAAMRRRR
jgi:hypothetical protein